MTRRDRERNPLNYTDAGVDTAAGEKAVDWGGLMAASTLIAMPLGGGNTTGCE